MAMSKMVEILCLFWGYGFHTKPSVEVARQDNSHIYHLPFRGRVRRTDKKLSSVVPKKETQFLWGQSCEITLIVIVFVSINCNVKAIPLDWPGKPSRQAQSEGRSHILYVLFSTHIMTQLRYSLNNQVQVQ